MEFTFSDQTRSEVQSVVKSVDEAVLVNFLRISGLLKSPNVEVFFTEKR